MKILTISLTILPYLTKAYQYSISNDNGKITIIDNTAENVPIIQYDESLSNQTECEAVKHYNGDQEKCENYFEKCSEISNSDSNMDKNYQNSICSQAYNYLLKYLPSTYFNYHCKNYKKLVKLEACYMKIDTVYQNCRNQIDEDIQGTQGLWDCQDLLEKRQETINHGLENTKTKLARQEAALENNFSVNNRRRKQCENRYSDENDIIACQNKFDHLEQYRRGCNNGHKLDCTLSKFQELDLPIKSGKSRPVGPCAGAVGPDAAQLEAECNKNLNLYRKYRLLCLIDTKFGAVNEEDCQLAHILKKIYHPKSMWKNTRSHPCLRISENDDNNNNDDDNTRLSCLKEHARWRVFKKKCSDGDENSCSEKRRLRKKLFGKRDSRKSRKNQISINSPENSRENGNEENIGVIERSMITFLDDNDEGSGSVELSQMRMWE